MNISTCKNCNKEFQNNNPRKKYCNTLCVQKEWYKNHPDKIIEKRFNQNSRPESMMFYRIKSRAKKLSIPFNLDISDIQIPEICPVLGIKLVRNLGHKGYSISSPSLDRIVPRLGYVKGNVRVISSRANLLKNDATIEELQKVLDDLRGILNESGPF